MELIDIVSRLTGDIYPVGESTEDGQRLANIAAYANLATEMVEELVRVADYARKSHESSVRLIGTRAIEACKELSAILDDIGNN